MHRRMLSGLGLVMAVAVAGVAQGREATLYPQAGFRFGSTIATGNTLGGSGQQDVELEDGPAWGLLLQFPDVNATALEVYASSGSSEVGIAGRPRLGISHLQFGGIKYIETGSVRPFIGASVGMAYFRLGSGSDSYRPAWSLYGGAEWPLGEHFSLRAEARWLGVILDSQMVLYCDGGCTVSFSSGSWGELEAQLGLGLRF